MNAGGTAAHQSDPHQRARLRWRARRGLLENDLILTRFLNLHEARLSDSEVTALSGLLDLSDNDLIDLILSRSQLKPELSSASLVRVLELIRAA